MSAPALFRNGSMPTVLLVHGAFCDASSWAGVISGLQTAGIPVFAVANPLRGAAADANYLRSVVDAVDGPVLLAGHSYGGVVIDRVAVMSPNVVGLVHVAAFALEEGESILDLTRRFPATLLEPALRPATFPGADGFPAIELYLKINDFGAVFGSDLPERVTMVAAAAQRPVAAVAFDEPGPVAMWEKLPRWCVVATADRAVHPDAQRFMANRAGADTIEIDASHAVAMAQPGPVAEHIRAAAVALRAAGTTRIADTRGTP